ncbi:MAG: P-II family nitrogen regulator, partial [Nitrospirota bacterium]
TPAAGAAPSAPVMPPVAGVVGSAWPAARRGDERLREQALLCEIIAIVRPSKRISTRKALEAAGVIGYTTYGVMGRSRQRGLKFSAGEQSGPAQPPAIKFLPKQLFSIVVDASQVKAAVAAIITANKSGKGGQYGDGRIFVLAVDQAVRVSTDERGGAAL